MITNLLLAALKVIVDLVINTRPPWVISIGDVSGAVASVRALDDLAPVHECLALAGIYIAGFTSSTFFKWQVKIIDWIADVIP